ncbi:MAG TPA: hypothetical protein VL547_09855 [Dinghuibacter sp.]|uniref:hypothetical protein n=1 Tax=Dinghuibacter sp. TaxID=2024697 RepID=UPI002CE8D10F|nr:hypothetical protein [Dinghuibacter sp.]HTJ12319.1 hypothetical protein [Dinghuibacter sp.]
MTLRLLMPALLLGAAGLTCRNHRVVITETPAYHDSRGCIELTVTGNGMTGQTRFIPITGNLDSIPLGSFPPNTRQVCVRGSWVNIPGVFTDRQALVRELADAYPELFKATDAELTLVTRDRTTIVRNRTTTKP